MGQPTQTVARTPRYGHLVAGRPLLQRLLLVLGILCLACPAAPVAADTPEWVEPQALNIADIAGQVPDSALVGNIVAYNGAGGIARFLSSDMDGDQLRIHVRLDTRRLWSGDHWLTYATTLGQRPLYDHVASTTPASWVRLYADGQEVTDQILWLNYLDHTNVTPTTDASAWDRYPNQIDLAHKHTIYCASMASGPDGVYVPANTGGEIVLPGDHPVMTATFTYNVQTPANVSYLGTQETAFQTYIGPCSAGDMGLFASLVTQMQARYPGIRHPRITLDIPVGANYVMFTYPPMDYDVYATVYDGSDPNNNMMRPIAGTVRLAPDEAMLSQNLTHGGAFPLDVAWQDADQSAGPYLSLMRNIDRITPPEYFVPPGVPYDPCFRDGACSDSLLDLIYTQPIPISIIYLSVSVSTGGMDAIPLRAADDPRYPVMCLQEGLVVTAVAPPSGNYVAYVPLLTRPLDVTRPAGLFEPESGRMVAYVD